MANPDNKKKPEAPSIPGLQIPAPEPSQVPSQNEIKDKVSSLEQSLKAIDADLKELKEQVDECKAITAKLGELKMSLYSMMIRQVDTGQDANPAEYEALLISEIAALAEKNKGGPTSA